MARLALVRGLSVLGAQPERRTAAYQANAALDWRDEWHWRWLTPGDGPALGHNHPNPFRLSE